MNILELLMNRVTKVESRLSNKEQKKINNDVKRMSKDELFDRLDFHNEKVIYNLENNGSDKDFLIDSYYCHQIENELRKKGAL